MKNTCEEVIFSKIARLKPGVTLLKVNSRDTFSVCSKNTEDHYFHLKHICSSFNSLLISDQDEENEYIDGTFLLTWKLERVLST